MKAAHKVGDFSSLGTYTLIAEITIPSKPKEKGTLAIYRDHEKQRIDINLGGYRETRLVLGNHEYVRPEHALIDAAKLVNFDRSWDPTQRIDPERETRADSWSDPSQRTVFDKNAWCVERMARYGQSTLCFDAQNSFLLERADPKVALNFQNYTEVVNEFVPAAASIKPEHVQEVDLSNIKITPGDIPADAWIPARDAIQVERCEIDFRPPHAKSTPPPDFPEAARRQNKGGLVVFFAVITRDGKVVLPQALGKDRYRLTDAARDTIKHWKFEPATCAGQPVNVSMELEVEFNLYQGRP